MCGHFGVTRSGFYAWCKRLPSLRRICDDALLHEVHAAHSSSRCIYGAPRVMHALRHQGIPIGQRRVARLMRLAHLQGRSARIYRRSRTASKAFFTSVPNRQRSVVPSRCNQVWVGDVTYLRVCHQWHYLAVVMDKFSRRIVGWSLSNLRDAALTSHTLSSAIALRNPAPGLIFHSDRGIEYAAHHFKALLRRHDIVQSMNRPGKMNDNAHMESFFHLLKSEFLYGKTFSCTDTLHHTIDDYVCFYNQQRLHSSLGHLCPLTFETNQPNASPVN